MQNDYSRNLVTIDTPLHVNNSFKRFCIENPKLFLHFLLQHHIGIFIRKYNIYFHNPYGVKEIKIVTFNVNAKQSSPRPLISIVLHYHKSCKVYLQELPSNHRRDKQEVLAVD